MDSPYFRSFSRPRFPSYAREVPLQGYPKKSPKVVNIPVHFVSEEKSRSDAALRIQKVLRGFLIRKYLRTISAIRREIEEIDRRISLDETVQLIARDPKERLRMNEMLMALLFRLDTVPGNDSGVRDCRKTLIKRAISLQDRLDAIVTGGTSSVDARDGGETQIQNPQMEDHPNSSSLACQNVAEEPVPTVETNESTNSLGEGSRDDGMLETGDAEGPLDERSALEDAVYQSLDLQSHGASSANSDEQEPSLGSTACQNPKPEASDESRDNADTPVEALNDAGKEVHAIKESEAVTEKDNEAENVTESSEYSHRSMVEEGEGKTPNVVEEAQEVYSQPDLAHDNMDESPPAENREKSGYFTDNDNGDKRRDLNLMERVVEDNERLTGLMAELLERSEMQTRMIGSLSQRVEQLERAFMCERLRRKKKRQAASMTLERQGTSPDTKKCVKKSP